MLTARGPPLHHCVPCLLRKSNALTCHARVSCQPLPAASSSVAVKSQHVNHPVYREDLIPQGAPVDRGQEC